MRSHTVRPFRFARLLAFAGLLAGCTTTHGRGSKSPGGDGAQAGGGVVAGDLAAMLGASDLPKTLDKPLAHDPMQVTVHRLKNGMTVYISTDRQKPRFTAWVGVRAGSRHDPPDSTGLAHYLEHMLFKGTDDYGTLDAAKEAPHVERVRKLYAELRGVSGEARAKIFAQIDAETQLIAQTAVPGELDRMYSTLGAQGLNAFTSDDQTVYIGDLPANRMGQWATVEAERFSDPIFRLFYPELEAVYEEKNLSLDRPETRVWEALMLALFPQHPYGTQTTIGSVEHLKTPAYQDMVDFFERWYVPNNMAIALAGDIDPAVALPILEEKFGRLQAKPLEQAAPGKVVVPKGRVVREVLAEGEESAILSWITVPEGHADEPVLAVMDRLLADEKVGLINTELVLTQKVPEAASFHSPQVEAGYFGVMARAGQGQDPETVEKMLLAVVRKLQAGDFTDADVEAAKLQEEIRQKLQLEFTFARVSKMMDAFISHREWGEVVERDRRFQTVTKKEVIAAAKKYLGGSYAVVLRKKGKPETPKIEKPKITPVKIDPKRQSNFARKLLATEVPELQPEWAKEGEHYVHRKLPAGDLIAAKNTRNDLFSLTYSFKRGYRKEPLLCHALELFEVSGSGDMTAEALQKKLYGLGVTVNTHCDAEYTEVTIEGLDAKLEDALAVVKAWIADPRFTDDDVRKLYENTIVRRKDGLEEDWRLSSALDTYAKYDKKSAWLQHPSNAKLAKADGKILARLITTLPNWQHRTLYFGTRDAEPLGKVVAMGARHKKTGDIPTRVYRRVNKPQIFFLHKDGAKANVRFAIPRGALARDRRPTARLLSEYLSGNMSALVFQEIREARGLAYTASSSYDVGRRPQDATGLLGFMSTQADKTPVAVETFLGLLRTDQIQVERLDQAKLSLDQEYRATRIDPRWVTRWVTGWDDMGEKSDPRRWEWETIGKLGVQDLSGFAKQFVGAPVIIGIVGDRTRVDIDALEKLGVVHELAAQDLFSYGPFPGDPNGPPPKKTLEAPKDAADKPKKTLEAPKDAADKPKKPAK